MSTISYESYHEKLTRKWVLYPEYTSISSGGPLSISFSIYPFRFWKQFWNIFSQKSDAISSTQLCRLVSCFHLHPIHRFCLTQSFSSFICVGQTACWWYCDTVALGSVSKQGRLGLWVGSDTGCKICVSCMCCMSINRCWAWRMFE